MKQMFSGILIIFSLFFLCGFAPKNKPEIQDDYIMLSLDFSSNGQIVQMVEFSVGSNRIKNLSQSLKEELDFRKALTNSIEGLRKEFLFNFALIYLKNPQDEFKINKGVVLSSVVYDEQKDSLGFQIAFSNLNSWNYYHNVETVAGDNKGEAPNLFLNKIKSQGTFPFSAKIVDEKGEENTIGERYKEKYLSSSKNLSFENVLRDEYCPTFVYNYSSFNKKLRSDADYNFYDKSNHLHHVWISSCADLKEKTITLYYYLINKGVWLAFAISIPVISMFLCIIYIKFKEKPKNKSKK